MHGNEFLFGSEKESQLQKRMISGFKDVLDGSGLKRSQSLTAATSWGCCAADGNRSQPQKRRVWKWEPNCPQKRTKVLEWDSLTSILD